MSKAQRQHRIAGFLGEQAITSQTQLVDLLDGEGITATQATVSRDLDEMGAIKVRVPGGHTVYAIPEHPVDRIAPEDHLRRVLADWVADIGWSGNLVVMRTPPGSAHVVASALDRAGMSTILGTVAGDDTIVVVAAESTSGTELADELSELAGL